MLIAIKFWFRKINSQATYAGAVLFINNEKYYLKEIIKVKKHNNTKRSIFFHENIADIFLTNHIISVHYYK